MLCPIGGRATTIFFIVPFKGGTIRMKRHCLIELITYRLIGDNNCRFTNVIPCIFLILKPNNNFVCEGILEDKSHFYIHTSLNCFSDQRN